MGVFPPTGLEYIATNMKDLVGEVTLLDLRYDHEYRDIKRLSEFITKEIDLLCISVTWDSQFDEICDLISSLPHDVTTVVGGHKATEEVEDVADRDLLGPSGSHDAKSSAPAESSEVEGSFASVAVQFVGYIGPE